MKDAPHFREVVGDIQDAIRGAILVAHNAVFDLRFLICQCEACKAPLPAINYLCTLQIVRTMGIDVSSRRLGVLCKEFGIPTGLAHSALDDAHATALLLGKLLNEAGIQPSPEALYSLGMNSICSDATSWAKTTPSGKEYRRSDAIARKQGEGWRLSQMFANLPARNNTTNSADEYLWVLERALEDRMITDGRK